MEMINVNVLGWSLNPELQHHRREFVRGRRYHLPVPKGFIYPFQIPRPTSGFGISRFELVREETGEVINVLAGMQATGLTVVSGETTDTIKYPGKVALPGEWEVGLYYARMSDAQSTWVSDYFCMTNDVENMVRLEWWHNEPIVYRDGCIDYSGRYRNYVYLPTDIGKPGYFTDKQVITKNGQEEMIRCTTWKQYNFEHLIPEYLADCLSRVTQHHNVRVHHLGREFVCESFSIPAQSWEEYGTLAITEFSFRTGTLITTRQSSSGVAQTGPDPGQCVSVRYVLNRVIGFEENRNSIASGDFAQFGIVGDHYGVYIPLTDGNGNPAGSFVVWQITHIQTNPDRRREREADVGDIIFDRESQRYYVKIAEAPGFVLPGVRSVVADLAPATTVTINAAVLEGAQVELYYKTEFGPYVLQGSYPASAFSGGFSVDADGWAAIKLKFVTGTCGVLQESEPFFLNLPDPEPLEGLDYSTTLGSYSLQ